MASPLDDLISIEHLGFGLELRLELLVVDLCVAPDRLAGLLLLIGVLSKG